MAETWTVLSRSPEETREVARALGRCVDPVPRAGLTVSLRGDLGAGKTVFAGGLVVGLGVPPGTPVPSPTFVVARAYRGRAPVHHVDAYHVHGRSELEAAGFEEMGGEGRVTVVEWGDRIEDALPADRLEVTLTPVADETPSGPDGAREPPRRIEVAARGPASARILARFREALARAGAP